MQKEKENGGKKFKFCGRYQTQWWKFVFEGHHSYGQYNWNCGHVYISTVGTNRNTLLEENIWLWQSDINTEYISVPCIYLELILIWYHWLNAHEKLEDIRFQFLFKFLPKGMQLMYSDIIPWCKWKHNEWGRWKNCFTQVKLECQCRCIILCKLIQSFTNMKKR